MVSLSICVGSSCHLKGSYEVIEEFKKEVKKRGLESEVELKAAFCLGRCAFEGVTIKVNDMIITGLTPERVNEVFEREVVPLLDKQ